MSVALAPALESYNSMVEIFEVPGLELVTIDQRPLL